MLTMVPLRRKKESLRINNHQVSGLY